MPSEDHVLHYERREAEVYGLLFFSFASPGRRGSEVSLMRVVFLSEIDWVAATVGGDRPAGRVRLDELIERPLRKSMYRVFIETLRQRSNTALTSSTRSPSLSQGAETRGRFGVGRRNSPIVVSTRSPSG